MKAQEPLAEYRILASNAEVQRWDGAIERINLRILMLPLLLVSLPARPEVLCVPGIFLCW